jgi:hypothetical protein
MPSFWYWFTTFLRTCSIVELSFANFFGLKKISIFRFHFNICTVPTNKTYFEITVVVFRLVWRVPKYYSKSFK